MKDDRFQGKYVQVSYVDSGYQYVFGGKLEKISLRKEGICEIFFEEMYDNSDGKYKLIKKDLPILKAIPLNNYRGVQLESKKTLQKFYREVNKQSLEIEEDEINEPINKLDKERDNLYKNTHIGFTTFL